MLWTAISFVRPRSDAAGDGLTLALMGIGVDDDVGARADLLNSGLCGVSDAMGPLERQIAVDLDGHVHEDPGSGAPDADLADAHHALHALAASEISWIRPSGAESRRTATVLFPSL